MVRFVTRATLVWRPYYWAVYRHEPELRPFLIRRRIRGGGKITAERRRQLRDARESLGVEW
jgi:hypothetical protein